MMRLILLVSVCSFLYLIILIFLINTELFIELSKI